MKAEMGTCQMFSKKSKEVRVSRVQWARRQVVGLTSESHGEQRVEGLIGHCNDFSFYPG